jgi:hypothetical protein
MTCATMCHYVPLRHAPIVGDVHYALYVSWASRDWCFCHTGCCGWIPFSVVCAGSDEALSSGVQTIPWAAIQRDAMRLGEERSARIVQIDRLEQRDDNEQ